MGSQQGTSKVDKLRNRSVSMGFGNMMEMTGKHGERGQQRAQGLLPLIINHVVLSDLTTCK